MPVSCVLFGRSNRGNSRTGEYKKKAVKAIQVWMDEGKALGLGFRDLQRSKTCSLRDTWDT